MEFKDGTYLKAADKAKIAKAFERFVKGGFKPTQFTKALYKHLSLHFSFIAHYNQEGFYHARFANPDGRLETVKMILSAGPWNYRDENTSGTADLNAFILKTIQGYQSEIEQQAKADKAALLRARIARDQAELEAL